MELKDFLSDPIHQAMSALLNEKVLSNKYTDTAPDVIRRWEAAGILDMEEGRQWKRFSIIDLVWLGLVNELREGGFGQKQFRQMKADLMKPIKGQDTPHPYLEYHLMVNILYHKPYYIVADKTGAANILNLDTYVGWLSKGEMRNSHVIVSLGGIYEKLLDRIQAGKRSFAEYFRLSPEEIQLLSFLKQNNFQTIKIFWRNGSIDRMEGVERMDLEKRIIDILNDGDYQKIELNQEKGKVVCIHRTVKKKINKLKG